MFNFYGQVLWTRVANTLLLLGAVSVFVLTGFMMPSSPQSLVLVSKLKSRMEISEAVSFSTLFYEKPDGLVVSCNKTVCMVKQDLDIFGNRFEKLFDVKVFNLKEAKMKGDGLENDLSFLAPPSSEYGKFVVFLPGSQELQDQLDKAVCVNCRNETNFCLSFIQGRKRCDNFCFNYPNDTSEETLRIDKIKSDRCTEPKN